MAREKFGRSAIFVCVLVCSLCFGRFCLGPSNGQIIVDCGACGGDDVGDHCRGMDSRVLFLVKGRVVKTAFKDVNRKEVETFLKNCAIRTLPCDVRPRPPRFEGQIHTLFEQNSNLECSSKG